MATYDPFKTIHPENRSELAQGDLDAIQKDIVMYLNDLSDDHIITLANHFVRLVLHHIISSLHDQYQ